MAMLETLDYREQKVSEARCGLGSALHFAIVSFLPRVLGEGWGVVVWGLLPSLSAQETSIRPR